MVPSRRAAVFGVAGALVVLGGGAFVYAYGPCGPQPPGALEAALAELPHAGEPLRLRVTLANDAWCHAGVPAELRFLLLDAQGAEVAASGMEFELEDFARIAPRSARDPYGEVLGPSPPAPGGYRLVVLAGPWRGDLAFSA